MRIIFGAIGTCGVSGRRTGGGASSVVEHGRGNCPVNRRIVSRFVSYSVFVSRGDLSFGAFGTGGGSFGERSTCPDRRPSGGRSSRRARG